MSKRARLEDLSVRDKVHHCIALYHDGVICPSEAWFQLALVLEALPSGGSGVEWRPETVQLMRARAMWNAKAALIRWPDVIPCLKCCVRS